MYSCLPRRFAEVPVRYRFELAGVEGEDRRQATLLPDCLEDYVAEDNPVRFIDAFVDGLDLAALGFIGACRKQQAVRATLPRTC